LIGAKFAPRILSAMNDKPRDSTTHFGFTPVDEGEKAQRVAGVFDSVATGTT
jgi:hypothetical protein